MTDKQTSFGDFGGSDAQDVAPEDSLIRRDKIALREAPENAEPTNPLSCPWCLAPPEDFVKRTNSEGNKQISCGNCSAVIPHESGWYLRGEKICLS